MREVELKAVLDSWRDCRARLERAGATRMFAGRIEDRRFDTQDRSLAARDIVLRLRVYRGSDGARAELEFKGATELESGYKVREEIGSGVSDPDDRRTNSRGARLHRHARDRSRDRAVGDRTAPWCASSGIRAWTISWRWRESPRRSSARSRCSALRAASFTAERLTDFAMRYEARTGKRAAVSDDGARRQRACRCASARCPPRSCRVA